MIRKELKRLSRRELVDIIYQLKSNEQELQAEVESLQNALQEKRIRLSEAGSIAEAASSITSVFSTAQEAANLYLYEISCLKEETQKTCEKMIEDAHKVVEKIFSDGEKLYNSTKSPQETEVRKQQMRREVIYALNEIRKQKLYEDDGYGTT